MFVRRLKNINNYLVLPAVIIRWQQRRRRRYLSTTTCQQYWERYYEYCSLYLVSMASLNPLFGLHMYFKVYVHFNVHYVHVINIILNVLYYKVLFMTDRISLTTCDIKKL